VCCCYYIIINNYKYLTTLVNVIWSCVKVVLKLNSYHTLIFFLRGGKTYHNSVVKLTMRTTISRFYSWIRQPYSRKTRPQATWNNPLVVRKGVGFGGQWIRQPYSRKTRPQATWNNLLVVRKGVGFDGQ